MVGLLQTGEGEGAGDEFAGFGDGGGWWLMRVEGAAVVFWGSELVSGRCKRRYNSSEAVGGSRGVMAWLDV